MLRNDFTDITSLIKYINDTKPYHTKLTDVVVEYQHNDNVNVSMEDEHRLRAHLSSAWEISTLSNGVTNRFRLPAVCLPRYSQPGNATHIYTRTGIVDEIPGQVGAYRVPYNNGMEVEVNGVSYEEGIHYNLVDPIHDIVYFVDEYRPVMGDRIKINLITIDRLFISVNDQWAMYTIEGYDEQRERYDPWVDAYDKGSWDVHLFDAGGFDDNPQGVELNKDQAYLGDGGDLFPGHPVGKPIGHIFVREDVNGGEYYEFVFDEDVFRNFLPRETRLTFKIEQTETYNNIARTVFHEEVTFKDLFKYSDTVGVAIQENAPIPMGWGVPKYDHIGFDVDYIEHTWIKVFQKFDEELKPGMTEIGEFLFNETHGDSFNTNVIDGTATEITTRPSDDFYANMIENKRNGFDSYGFDIMPFDLTTPQPITTIAGEQDGDDVATTSISDEVTFTITDLPPIEPPQ